MRAMIHARSLLRLQRCRLQLSCGSLISSSPSSPSSSSSSSVSSLVEEAPADQLPGLSLEQINKIAHTDQALRQRHIKIEGDIASDSEREEVRRKRMIYRSKQRGWLEADLLMGSWAQENVPHLSKEELDEYEVVLNVETIDVYNYISGKDELPSHLKDLSVMKKLQGYALKRNMASPEGYEKMKIKANLT